MTGAHSLYRSSYGELTNSKTTLKYQVPPPAAPPPVRHPAKGAKTELKFRCYTLHWWRNFGAECWERFRLLMYSAFNQANEVIKTEPVAIRLAHSTRDSRQTAKGTRSLGALPFVQCVHVGGILLGHFQRLRTVFEGMWQSGHYWHWFALLLPHVQPVGDTGTALVRALD